MKRDSADPKFRRLDNERPLVAANEEPREERWSRPARFLFIFAAAIAC